MAQFELAVEPRITLGKKVRFLRRAGIMPANIYGRGRESLAVQAPTAEVRRILRTAGQTGVVSLVVAGESRPRPALVRGVQLDALGDEMLHVDFIQVDMAERMTAVVPLVITGESQAVRRGGVMILATDSLTVEALPGEIPNEIAVDISSLDRADDSVFVRDLPLPAGVVAATDPDTLVVKIQSARVTAAAEEEAGAGAEAVVEVGAEEEREAAPEAAESEA